jgi:hypothetical protein
VRPEGIGKLKKKMDIIGSRIRDLPACSIAPQPTTLLPEEILCTLYGGVIEHLSAVYLEMLSLSHTKQFEWQNS